MSYWQKMVITLSYTFCDETDNFLSLELHITLISHILLCKIFQTFWPQCMARHMRDMTAPPKFKVWLRET